MRMWLVPALVVVAVVWAGWAKRRMQRRHLAALVHYAGGDPNRARRVTLLTGSVTAALATVAVAGAFVAEGVRGWWWLRMVLSLLVIVVYVPYTMTLAEVTVKLKVRKSPQQRMLEMGAAPAVARQIAAVGRPFAYYGSLVMLAAVIAFLWHLFGR